MGGGGGGGRCFVEGNKIAAYQNILTSCVYQSYLHSPAGNLLLCSNSHHILVLTQYTIIGSGTNFINFTQQVYLYPQQLKARAWVGQ